MWSSQFVIGNVMQEYQISDPTLAYQLIVKQFAEYTNIYRKIFGKPDNKVNITNLFNPKWIWSVKEMCIMFAQYKKQLDSWLIIKILTQPC